MAEDSLRHALAALLEIWNREGTWRDLMFADRIADEFGDAFEEARAALHGDAVPRVAAAQSDLLAACKDLDGALMKVWRGEADDVELVRVRQQAHGAMAKVEGKTDD